MALRLDRRHLRPGPTSRWDRQRRRGAGPTLALRPRSLLRMLTAAPVKVFGRLHDDPIHTRRRQAFEKCQWTKSREAGTTGRRALRWFDRGTDADEGGPNVGRPG